MPTLVACLWRRVEATQLGRVPTHFGPATRLRRPESPWNQGALATSQVEMCPRTANSGQAEVGADVARAPEAVGPVDGGAERERGQRADAGHPHQPAADRLVAHHGEDLPGEPGQLAAHTGLTKC